MMCRYSHLEHTRTKNKYINDIDIENPSFGLGTQTRLYLVGCKNVTHPEHLNTSEDKHENTRR